jgi:hypothetical protein
MREQGGTAADAIVAPRTCPGHHSRAKADVRVEEWRDVARATALQRAGRTGGWLLQRHKPRQQHTCLGIAVLVMIAEAYDRF